MFWKQSQPKPEQAWFYWPGGSQLLQLNTRMDGGIGRLPRWGAGGWGKLTCAFDTAGHASLLEISSSLCTQDLALWESCVRLWLWFLSFPQICSWFTAGKSHAPTQLLFNKGQISLPFPLPSLSLLSLQFKFNITQQFLVPQRLHTIYSHDMQHDCLPFYPASTSFYTQFFFFQSLHFGQVLWFLLHDINRKQNGPSHSLPKTLF